MEASLLVAPKLFSATRGGLTRSRIVASTGGREKAQQRPWSDKPRAHVGVLAAAAATSMMSNALPCGANSLQQQEEEAMRRAVMVVGELSLSLSPETAKVVIGVAGPALSALGFLFILRIVMSWYPKLPVREFPYVVAYAPTEPFLAVTRKVIPPLGGVDVTPVVWFGLVSFLSEILVGPQGLLVLLSQQR